jgi:hypothetical protein
MTIGTVWVAFFSNSAAGVVVTAMTSGLQIEALLDQRRVAAAVAVGRQVDDVDVAAVDIAALAQPIEKSVIGGGAVLQRAGVEGQKAQSRDLGFCGGRCAERHQNGEKGETQPHARPTQVHGWRPSADFGAQQILTAFSGERCLSTACRMVKIERIELVLRRRRD